jgi:hypothetical protein
MVSNLIFEYSPWWLPVCIVVGVLYAAILYNRIKVPWSKSLSGFLAVFRFLLVSFISLLLISPFLNQTKNNFEKPLTILAIDNSQSMQLTEDSIKLQTLASSFLDLKEQLLESGYEVQFQSLDNKNLETDSELSFDYPQTDLSLLLRDIQNDFEGRNLGSVALLSDGIYTRGTAPVFTNLTYPVYSIGVGDTIPKKDLILKNVVYNKITYQGNQFPLIVEVLNEGFINDRAAISITHKGKSIASESISFSRNNQLQQVRFLIDAEENGLQRYSISLEQLDEEFTYANNYQQAYIDVIDGKEKILIVAPSPHPDIKSVTAAIEKNENYEVHLYIPGIQDMPTSELEKELDLVILHQGPDKRQRITSYQKKIEDLDLPSLYIIGGQTNIAALNDQIFPNRINAVRNEGDLITTLQNPDFNFFKLSEELSSFMESYPPVRVPFGQVDTDAETSTLLYQRVGSIETTRPLLLFRNADSKKSGVLFGEGLWQWRLFEYSRNQSTVLFDELILKSVQFLSSKEDRRKFRVYPQQNEFIENEPVVLETETYNSLYEPIFGIKVDLTLQNDLINNSYTFVTSESNSRFVLRDLDPGVYSYSASAIVNEKMENVSGQFVVKTMDLEAINLTADHRLLQELSNNIVEASFSMQITWMICLVKW